MGKYITLYKDMNTWNWASNCIPHTTLFQIVVSICRKREGFFFWQECCVKWQAVPGPGSQGAIHKQGSHEIIKKWWLPAIQWCLKHHGRICAVKGGRNGTILKTAECTRVSNGTAVPAVQRHSQVLPVWPAEGIRRSVQPWPAPAGGSASRGSCARPRLPQSGSSPTADRQHRKR